MAREGGREIRWLEEGLAAFESQRADPAAFYGRARRYLRELRCGAHGDKLMALADLPDAASLSGQDRVLAEAQAWGVVTFLVDQYGLEAVRALIRELADGRPLDVAFRQATGVSLAAFQEAWMAAAARGLIPQRFIEMAQEVDPARVLQTVETLRADEYRSRAASSPEADAVVAYLADGLAGLGLQPAGEDGSLFQTVGRSVKRFTCRQDFVERVGGVPEGGAVERPLVWVRGLEFPDMRLSGKVVLVKTDRDQVEEVACRAAEHSAAGLVTYTEVRPRPLQARTPYAVPEITPTIPVVALDERKPRSAGETISLAAMMLSRGGKP